MAHRGRQLVVWVAGLVASLAGPMAAVAQAGDVPSALERHLRERRPDVLRWEIAATERESNSPRVEGEILDVGRIAARTAVRFTDGRVRWFVVAGYRPVNVSRQPLEAGADIDRASIEMTERDVIALSCLPVSIDSAGRWRSTRRLATGDPLCGNSVERAPEVQRDRAVTLSTDRGPIRVSRRLTAAADARVGERVRLLDRATGAIVLAIVTGPDAARLPE
jgi:flagella basal body P-ring formation protein FlgA